MPVLFVVLFTALITSLLQKYLSQFVKNFDSSNLQIFALQGYASLKNLELKAEALDFLDLPLAVKGLVHAVSSCVFRLTPCFPFVVFILVAAGYVGSIDLTIPFTRLGSQPVVVVLDRIFLVAGTKSEFKVNEEEEKKRALENKRAILKAHELATFPVEEPPPSSPPAGSAAGAGDSFTARLVEKIVDNVQVQIKRIHIRYEDTSQKVERDFSSLVSRILSSCAACSSSLQDHPFSFGVSIGEISAMTTDPTFQHNVFSVNQPVVFKSVTLRDFSIYLNPATQLMPTPLTLPVLDTLADIFCSHMHNCRSTWSENSFLSFVLFCLRTVLLLSPLLPHRCPRIYLLHIVFCVVCHSQYLLRPLSGFLHVKMQKNEVSPKIEVESRLDTLDIAVQQTQYLNVFTILASLSHAQAYGKYLRYRPDMPVHGNAKKWWQHAGHCLQRDQRDSKKQLRMFVSFGRPRARYTQLYVRKLNANWLPKLTPPEEQELAVCFLLFLLFSVSSP